jgi:hypothetical protein
MSVKNYGPQKTRSEIMLEEWSLPIVLFTLRDYGVDYIIAEYSGGGDHGAIDGITYANEQDVTEYTFDNADWQNSTIHQNFIEFTHPQKDDIEIYLNEIFYSQLDGTEDWCNNDGGYGTMMIRTLDGAYTNNHNTYYTETENYFYEGSVQKLINSNT